jgi:hypothetical protein
MQLTFVAAIVMAHVISGCFSSNEQLLGSETDLMCLITPAVLAYVFVQPGHLYRTAAADEFAAVAAREAKPGARATGRSEGATPKEPWAVLGKEVAKEAASTSKEVAAEESAEPAAADAEQGWLGGGWGKERCSSSLSDEYCASSSMKVDGEKKPMMTMITVVLC